MKTRTRLYRARLFGVDVLRVDHFILRLGDSTSYVSRDTQRIARSVLQLLQRRVSHVLRFYRSPNAETLTLSHGSRVEVAPDGRVVSVDARVHTEGSCVHLLRHRTERSEVERLHQRSHEMVTHVLQERRTMLEPSTDPYFQLIHFDTGC